MTQVPLISPRYQSPPQADGTINALGLVYTYVAGSVSTPKDTYTDSTGGTPNANPVVLDATGKAAIWGTGSYKIVVKTAGGVTIATDDNYTSFNTSSGGSTFADNAFTIQDESDATKQFQVQLSGITTGSTIVMTIPDANFTPIGAATTQTLTNKTLDTTNTIGVKDSLFTIKDDSDTTKIAAFQASGITTGTTRTFTFPDASGTIALASTVSAVVYNAQSTTYTILSSDNAKLVDFTGSSNTTFTFTAVATLGSGWFCYIRNNGTANAELTIDGAGAELVDGLANYIMYPGEVRLVQCTGAAFNSVVLQPFDTGAKVATFTWTKPPGYKLFDVWLWGAGASGGKGATNGGGGGGGGGCAYHAFLASALSSTVSVTIGAGGAGQASANTAGNAGNSSTFGAYLTAFGGGRGGGSSGGAGGGGGGSGFISNSSSDGSFTSGVGGNATTTTAGTGGVSWTERTPPAAATTGGTSSGGGGGNSGSLPGGGGFYGGGGGGCAQPGVGGNGGYTIYGGAGGGSAGPNVGNPGAGGFSQFGGNGGAGAYDANNATAGSAPGGGGGGSETGTSGAGGDGGCRVTGRI